MDLVSYLENHEIVHPTTVDSIEFRAEGNLTFTLRGFPWWRSGRTDGHSQGVLNITIKGVTRAAFDITSLGTIDCEDMEDFVIFRTETIAELTGPLEAVYANSQIPDPFALVTAVDEALSRSVVPMEPRDVLNYGRSLVDFRRYASGRSMLVARGTAGCLDVVKSELRRQGVRISVMSAGKNAVPSLFIRLFGGHTFAEEITASEQ